ncbi:hypothetical protein HPB50_003469 [Hyalomma asiaticum]|uniref:Uncharacterized protein n=1 Tax=Hyalomma asiaticum TaxID=266040 RepID=A0ACB7S047_HYAAI|nr:hypothetical protein HPB50_003469 [Hyalomma asiaticum]
MPVPPIQQRTVYGCRVLLHISRNGGEAAARFLGRRTGSQSQERGGGGGRGMRIPAPARDRPMGVVGGSHVTRGIPRVLLQSSECALLLFLSELRLRRRLRRGVAAYRRY